VSAVSDVVGSPLVATIIGGLLTLGGITLKERIDTVRQKNKDKLKLLSNLHTTTKKLLRLRIERLDHQLWFAFYKRTYALVANKQNICYQ